MERYMSFSVRQETTWYDQIKKKDVTKTTFNLKFIDSFQFMSSSVETLVTNLKDSGIEKFKYTTEEFQDSTELTTRKGIYPYSYMDSWQKFNETCCSLTPQDFTKNLTSEEISLNNF